MKTPVPLSNAVKWLGNAASRARRIPEQIFGDISWHPPRWLSRTGENWSRLESAYPRLIAPAIITIFLISCAGSWTWNWYSHLPKPRRVSVKIVPVEVTKLEKELKIPRLVVYFSESAARLEDLKKSSVQGPQLQPRLNGAWRWLQADILVFEPTDDWPADQKFRVVFDKKFFPSHVLMERFVYETQTPSFEIAIKQLELYQDPTNPTQRAVTATLELTHAVDPGELDRHLQFTMVAGSNIFSPNDPAPHFSITYGLHRRVAFVHSSPITLPERDDFVKLTLNKGVRTAQGDAQTKNSLEQKLRVPSIASMFQIDSIQTTIARNKNGEPEQLVVLTTTADIGTRELAKALEIKLLPKRKIPETDKAEEETEDVEQTRDEPAGSDDETDASEQPTTSDLKESERWKSETDVPDDVLDNARPVACVSLPSEKAQDRQHAFRIRVETDGEREENHPSAAEAVTDFAAITARLKPCPFNAESFSAAGKTRCKSKARVVFLRLTAKRNCRSAPAGWVRSNSKSAGWPQRRSIIWSAKPKDNFSTRISSFPITSIKKTFRGLRSSDKASPSKTSGKQTIRRSILASICASRPTAGANAVCFS